jgi:hypothetical protein
VATFTTATPTLVGPSEQYTLSGATITSSTLYAAHYLAPDGSGNLQAWQIPLTNTASVPVATQIGLITGAPFATTTVCGTHTAAQNLGQPATGFGIIQYAVAPNTCSPGGGSETVLINASQSSSAAAMAVPPAAFVFADMYFSSGVLYGLVALDTTSGNLYLYPAVAGVPTFTSPVTLVAGVASASHQAITINRSAQIINTVSFSAITFPGNPAPASEMVRVDTTGAVTTVYTATGTLETDDVSLGQEYDNTNLYFVDAVTSGSNTTYNFVKAPIAGGAASVIGSVTAAGGVTYAFYGSDGTSLIIREVNGSTTTLYTLAITGPSSQTPTQILQVTSGTVEGGLDYATGKLFLTEVGTSGFSGLVLKPSGATPSTPLLGPTANLSFSFIWNDVLVQTGTWLEMTGLPTSPTSEAGAELALVSTSTLTAGAAFTCPSCGSGAYTVPANGAVGVGQINATLGIGELTFNPSTTLSQGVLANLQTLQLQQLAVSGSNVTIFY